MDFKNKLDKEIGFKYFSRVPAKEQSVLAKRLAFLIKAGVPILDGLKTLQRQTRSRSKAKLFDRVIDDVANGQYLSTSLAKSKSIFGDFAVNMIRVGEESGTLNENLDYISEELKKRHALKRTVRGALIYPVFVAAMSLLVTSMILVFVFPKILPIFKDLGGRLPVTTKILIGTSDFLLHYGIFVLAGLILTTVAFIFTYKKTPKFKYALDRIAISLPIFGKLARDYQSANLCRTLGLLLKSQQNITSAITITASTLSNDVYRRGMEEMSVSVMRGMKMSEHMEKYPILFPEMTLQAVSVGEMSSNLVDTLIYLSDYYEHEVEETTTSLSSYLEPILMVGMGLLVGFIVVSVITPIYAITQNIHP